MPYFTSLLSDSYPEKWKYALLNDLENKIDGHLLGNIEIPQCPCLCPLIHRRHRWMDTNTQQALVNEQQYTEGTGEWTPIHKRHRWMSTNTQKAPVHILSESSKQSSKYYTTGDWTPIQKVVSLDLDRQWWWYPPQSWMTHWGRRTLINLGGGAHVDQPGYYGQKNTIYPYRVLKFIWAFN